MIVSKLIAAILVVVVAMHDEDVLTGIAATAHVVEPVSGHYDPMYIPRADPFYVPENSILHQIYAERSNKRANAQKPAANGLTLLPSPKGIVSDPKWRKSAAAVAGGASTVLALAYAAERFALQPSRRKRARRELNEYVERATASKETDNVSANSGAGGNDADDIDDDFEYSVHNHHIMAVFNAEQSDWADHPLTSQVAPSDYENIAATSNMPCPLTETYEDSLLGGARNNLGPTGLAILFEGSGSESQQIANGSQQSKDQTGPPPKRKIRYRSQSPEIARNLPQESQSSKIDQNSNDPEIGQSPVSQWDQTSQTGFNLPQRDSGSPETSKKMSTSNLQPLRRMENALFNGHNRENLVKPATESEQSATRPLHLRAQTEGSLTVPKIGMSDHADNVRSFVDESKINGNNGATAEDADIKDDNGAGSRPSRAESFSEQERRDIKQSERLSNEMQTLPNRNDHKDVTQQNDTHETLVPELELPHASSVFTDVEAARNSKESPPPHETEDTKVPLGLQSPIQLNRRDRVRQTGFPHITRVNTITNPTERPTPWHHLMQTSTGVRGGSRMYHSSSKKPKLQTSNSDPFGKRNQNTADKKRSEAEVSSTSTPGDYNNARSDGAEVKRRPGGSVRRVATGASVGDTDTKFEAVDDMASSGKKREPLPATKGWHSSVSGRSSPAATQLTTTEFSDLSKEREESAKRLRSPAAAAQVTTADQVAIYDESQGRRSELQYVFRDQDVPQLNVFEAEQIVTGRQSPGPYRKKELDRRHHVQKSLLSESRPPETRLHKSTAMEQRQQQQMQRQQHQTSQQEQQTLQQKQQQYLQDESMLALSHSQSQSLSQSPAISERSTATTASKAEESLQAIKNRAKRQKK